MDPSTVNPSLPQALEHEAAQRVDRYLRAARDLTGDLQSSDAVNAAMPRVFCLSEFVTDACRRDPALLNGLIVSGDLIRRYAVEEFAWRVRTLLQDADSEAGAMKILRDYRRREMVRIAWRDLAGWAGLDEVLHDLSSLADACISAASNFAAAALEERHGRPRDADGNLQELVVLAMGKLGGRELNFSSDIDLVFLYPESGETDGPRCLSNEQYFARLGQMIIRLLDTVTGDGRVFRVDMRLRPFGEAGPLAMSFTAFELYLQEQGREWERYAYIKSRPVTGEAAADALYAEVLRPFVYRRYLDFGVFQSLRDMKRLIMRENRQSDLRDNVKMGSGGIREIEFVVQALQLVRGGSYPDLQCRELRTALRRLADHRFLRRDDTRNLDEAYEFLRRLENRLQEFADGQVHTVPSDPLERERLAVAMRFADWDTLDETLERHRQNVAESFRNIVFGADDEPDRDAGLESLLEIEPESAGALLGGLGFRKPDAVLALLRRLRDGAGYRRLDTPGRQRLEELVPKLLRATARTSRPESALEGALSVVEAVGRRSAYLALLIENPDALNRLVEICAESGFLTRQVADHPLLLDELLDPRIFREPPTRGQFEMELDQRFTGIADDDVERQMEALRQFKRAAVFRIAVADLSGRLTLMHVSDRLTDMAEIILGKALELAWAQLVAKYGRPMAGTPDLMTPTGFAVIAYGKLGGIELGYGSDLDLVFVHNSAGEVQQTEGGHGIENAVFFARLGRKIIHWLTIPTSSGLLYEVDTRLRPSGKSGLLVTSLDAFARYQREEAWTWEHQALLRARAVAGNGEVAGEFEEIRREIVCREHDDETLRADVTAMRDRMRRELSRGTADSFDVKQDRGGLADLEFLVQYRVLRHAAEHPGVCHYSDNVRQLEALAFSGCIPAETAARLTEIYLEYRGFLHRRSLEGGDGTAPVEDFAAQRSFVIETWTSEFGES